MKPWHSALPALGLLSMTTPARAGAPVPPCFSTGAMPSAWPL